MIFAFPARLAYFASGHVEPMRFRSITIADRGVPLGPWANASATWMLGSWAARKGSRSRGAARFRGASMDPPIFITGDRVE